MIDRRLLDDILRFSPHQPATSLWRAVEIGALLRSSALPTTGRGLDLGCGDGRVTELIRRRLGCRWELVGLDPDEDELGLAAELGLYAALHAAPGDRIPEPGESFDFVFSNSVLEHVPDLPPVLDEVARVLRPSGRFVLTVPTEAIHRYLAGPAVLGRLATGAPDRAGYLAAIDRRLAHVNLWDEQRWRSELERRGLDVELAVAYLSPAEVRRWEAVANASAGLLARVIGRGRSPIELQRDLGLRRARPPLWLAAIGRAIGHASALGLDGRGPGEGGACLLLTAVKRRSA